MRHYQSAGHRDSGVADYVFVYIVLDEVHALH